MFSQIFDAIEEWMRELLTGMITSNLDTMFTDVNQKTGKELMSRDELAVMDGEKCILQLRGVRPFLSNKYDITKHKRYKELADFNKNNAFDVEKYLAHRLVMSKDTEFEMYEVTVTQEDVSAIEAEESED